MESRKEVLLIVAAALICLACIAIALIDRPEVIDLRYKFL